MHYTKQNLVNKAEKLIWHVRRSAPVFIQSVELFMNSLFYVVVAPLFFVQRTRA